MKTELTQEEKDLIPVIEKKWIDLALVKNVDGIDKPLFEKGINWLYDRFLKLPNPQVVYCDGLIEALIKITLVKDYDKELEDYSPDMVQKFYDKELDEEFISKVRANYSLKSSYCGWSNFGWVSFYDYFTEIKVVDNPDFNQYKEIIQSNVFETFEFEHVVFAVQPPIKIVKNDNNQLHNPLGASIEFIDGSKFYYINGREIDGELITKGFTKERFMTETNEDIRGAMYTIIEGKGGEGAMLDFLGAYEFDNDVITHQNGDKEILTLYRTTETFSELQDINGKRDVPLCWLRLVCPSTGQNYLIATDPSFEKAVDAIKFHRPEDVPFDLDYTWMSRS